jgi:hypothetical protein
MRITSKRVLLALAVTALAASTTTAAAPLRGSRSLQAAVEVPAAAGAPTPVDLEAAAPVAAEVAPPAPTDAPPAPEKAPGDVRVCVGVGCVGRVVGLNRLRLDLLSAG